MRIKIYYKNKAFFGGVIGKTSNGKVIVSVDSDESEPIDIYRRIGEVILMKNGRPVKNVNKLAKKAA